MGPVILMDHILQILVSDQLLYSVDYLVLLWMVDNGLVLME